MNGITAITRLSLFVIMANRNDTATKRLLIFLLWSRRVEQINVKTMRLEYVSIKCVFENTLIIGAAEYNIGATSHEIEPFLYVEMHNIRQARRVMIVLI